jgi:colicin import membrane protein
MKNEIKGNLSLLAAAIESWKIKSFYHSFYLHLFLGILILISTTFHLWNTAEEGIVIVPSIQVDLVSMPKYTLEELRKMDLDVTKEVQKEEVKVEDAPSPSKESETPPETAEASAKLDDLLEKMSKKKVSTKSIPTDSKVKITDERKREELKRLVLEGNKLMQGQAVEGLSDQQLDDELSIYTAQLSTKIKPFWILPSYLIDRPLRARIKVYIDATGKLLSHEVLSSSGDNEFDQRAVAALIKASPFLIPHKDIVPRLLKGNVVVVFPL